MALTDGEPAVALDGPALEEVPAAMVEVPLDDTASGGRVTVVPHDEVVRLDLSDLADAEAEAILDVLGKDSVFRAEEKGRIDKIEAELHEETVRQRSQEQQHKDARRACVRCGQTFRILFNKRLVCQLCGASVCRRCARYEQGRRGWICLVCERERELQANKWLSEIQLRHRVSIRTPGSRFSDSEDDSGYDPSVTHDEAPRQKASGVTPVSDPDRVTAEVRGHLENVVETLLGESIQNASIRPASSDAALYSEYHTKLVEAIGRLTQSLCMTLQNRPLDDTCSPTTTLAELKTVLLQAQEAAMRLPLREEVDDVQVAPSEARSSLTSPDGCGEEPNSHTYEEILATAVLSRLGEKGRRAAAASYCDAAVQSDDVTPLHCGDVTSLESGGRPGSEAEETDGEEHPGGGGPGVLEITIEEEIEEIVTYDNEEDAGSRAEDTDTEGESRRGSLASQASTLHSTRSSEASSGDDVSLPGPSISYSDLNFAGGKSVPFPELGKSLPEASQLEDGDEEELERSSWEQNWLFRRRRLTPSNRLLGEQPVPMLVPDPSQPTAVTVGSREVDELSDLSERGSETSLDDWTSSPPVQDVTARLKAARDADRDRYLSAARLHSPHRRASADPPESIKPPRDSRRPSADPASLSGASGAAQAAAAAAAPAPAPATSEVSLSRAISWSSVPSDVEQAFSAVSERLAAGSPPADSQIPAVSDDRLPQVERTASSAKRTDSSAERTASSSARSVVLNPLTAVVRTREDSAPPRYQEISAGERSGVGRQSEEQAPLPKRTGQERTRTERTPPERTERPEPQRVSVPAGACSEVVAQAGTTVQFRCKAPVLEGSETHWLREGVILEPGERYEMYRVRDQHHLVAYGVTRRDSGRFSCIVVTGDEETWHHFKLRVLASSRPAQKPRFTLVPDRQHQVVTGGALRLVLRVTGHPEPRVTFLRADRPLQHSQTVRIERHSGGEWVLVVQPVHAADAGQYHVQAANSHGSDRQQFDVAVVPPPEIVLPESPPPTEPVPQPARVAPVASPSPVSSPPSYITSRDEALKETSLTEACNSVILRARPARVRSPAEGGRDSESEEEGEEICLPQPPPGTIAEREHRKWENAVAMPNNPYTRERVRQRQSRPLDRTGYYSTHYSSGDDGSDHDLVSTDSSKIDCGLKSINSERYRRDYYINAGARGRWSSLPSAGRRQGGASRPVSALSEEPLPPLSTRASSDDLRSAGGESVYHSSESLAATERVSSASPAASRAASERRSSTRSPAGGSAASAVGDDELPPEGTVRSAIERMQQLSRSAEELAGRRPRLTPPVDATDGGRGTASASPSVPVVPTPTPPPPPPPPPEATQAAPEPEPAAARRSPLWVDVEEATDERTGGLEQRPSPDGRESLASNGSDLPPTLPSVKELRSHFQAGGTPAAPLQKQESPLYNSSVFIIDKSEPDPEAWDEPRELRKVEKLRKKTSNHKVHSLTARSVSREFREGLKLGAPLSLHAGNIRDPDLLSGQRASLPVVIDERAENGDDEERPAGELAVAPGTRLVASRAAFWDRKVAQELS